MAHTDMRAEFLVCLKSALLSYDTLRYFSKPPLTIFLSRPLHTGLTEALMEEQPDLLREGMW